MSVRIICVVLWVGGLWTGTASAQNFYKSPYTVAGIGDVFTPGLTHNQAMGGYGLLTTDGLFINHINPSLLPYNFVTTFDFGLQGETRNIGFNDAASENTGANLRYLTIAFPFKTGKWATAVSLQPYSYANYGFSFISFNEDTGAPVFNEVEGNGGYNEAAISTGIKILRGLYVGGRASLIFGTLERRSSVIIDDRSFPPSFQISESNNTNISDAKFSLSGTYVYPIKLSADSTKAYFLKIGGVYDFGADLNASNETVITRTALGSGQSSIEDTLSTASGSVYFPSRMIWGIALQKGDRWNIGLDVYMQNWNDYENFFGENDGLQQQTRLILGGEWTPDFQSVNNYFARITYRAGASYSSTPYQIENTDINEFGINFGLTLPVGLSRQSFGSLNLGFGYGQRGKNTPDIIKETYYRVFLGFTFNSQWFQKPKFN